MIGCRYFSTTSVSSCSLIMSLLLVNVKTSISYSQPNNLLYYKWLLISLCMRLQCLTRINHLELLYYITMEIIKTPLVAECILK